MEFKKDRVYSAVNADELKPGDKVIVANTLGTLKRNVANNVKPLILLEVIDEDYDLRFEVNFNKGRYALAYLVERAENCLKCKKCEVISDKSMHCDWVGTGPITSARVEKCNHYEPKTGKKEMCLNCKHYNKVNDFRDCTIINNPTGACPHYEAEPTYKWVNYRPFKDTDELIKVWDAKMGTPNWGTNGDLTMPHIWVREKGCNKSADLITCYGSKGITVRGEGMYFDTLFTMFEFLDGSPCGVEE